MGTNLPDTGIVLDRLAGDAQLREIHICDEPTYRDRGPKLMTTELYFTADCNAVDV